MQEPDVHLYWSQPYTLAEILSDDDVKDLYDERYRSGVYLWTHLIDRKEEVAYVGKATGNPTLWRRQVEHYVQQVGGRYALPKGLFDMDDKGFEPKIFTDQRVRDIYLDESKHRQLLEASRRYVATVGVHFAPADTELLSQIERVLLYHLVPTMTTWGTKSEPATKLIIENINAPWRGKVAGSNLPDRVFDDRR